jgi:hypothetical protein
MRISDADFEFELLPGVRDRAEPHAGFERVAMVDTGESIPEVLVAAERNEA